MCGTTGALVPYQTVEYQIKEDIEPKSLSMEVFSLCMDPICDMAYYSADYGYLYFTHHIKAMLDHKDETVKKYVCYCQEITYDEVKKAVNNEGIKTIKAFFKYRKPVIVERCKVINPFGCSCIADIKKIIEDELYPKKD